MDLKSNQSLVTLCHICAIISYSQDAVVDERVCGWVGASVSPFVVC